MTRYHNRLTIRERLAKPLYKIPFTLRPVFIERFLALKLIPFIEGANPHWKHLGKDCPCMGESN